MKEPIKVALPKGRLLADTASLLTEAGWGLDDYNAETRLYHLRSATFPKLTAKIFNEKDIPIQVAVGNYDLGICGLDWIEELLAKYPGSEIIKVKDLCYGNGSLVVYTSPYGECSFTEFKKRSDNVRIASEYPNLAESFMASNRFRRFNVFPLWGAAEVYPPENAELVVLSGVPGRQNIRELNSVYRLLDYSTFLIANRRSWEAKDMSRLLSSIKQNESAAFPASISIDMNPVKKPNPYSFKRRLVKIAVPDGHQQPPAHRLLTKAGIILENYKSSGGNRRPESNLQDVSFKVIRPQDMPLQVANGNFDLAITGKDWLNNHLFQFPSSPVRELLDLKFAKVRIVAVVHNNFKADDVKSLRRYSKECTTPLRIATEYTNIADKYARDNHLGMYQIIPTWGATETFLPDDADMLIDNTETGKTLIKNNLKIIDTIFESTGCLIGKEDEYMSKEQKDKIKDIIAMLHKALEES